MSGQLSNLVSGKLFMWCVIVLGLYASIQAGVTIADGGFAGVILNILGILWVLAVISIRQFWWIPLFVSLVIGFSSTALGFKIQGTDVMGLLSLSCLIARLSMGQLRPLSRERALGSFFYLTLIFVGGHLVFYGLHNFFFGDTQFKNIAKAYYAAFFPLLFLWLIDLYADPDGLKKSINAQLILSVLLVPIALVVIIFGIPIPLISSEEVNFSWADIAGGGAAGFLRWTILPVLFLAVCLTESSRGGWRIFYRFTAVLLLGANLFGGGRVGLLIITLFFPIWMMIRGKWNQFVVSGWMILIAAGSLFIMGHTLDTKFLHNMPEGFKNVERACSIFLPEDQKDQSQLMTEGSDQWHQDLAIGAWESATKDMTTFIFGNGFKGWDDSIDINMFAYGAAYEFAVKMAVRMGLTETHFFSILTIFGALGVLFYYGFMIELLRRTLRLMKKCPEGSFPQSLCVFSASFLLVTLITSPIGGAIPSYNMIYWILGSFTASSYLAASSQGNGVTPTQRHFAS